MTTDEWNALLNKLTEAWEQFAVTVRQAADTLAKIFGQIRGYGDKLGLLEEIADAYICLSFLESIFDVKPEDLQKAIDVKLQRERENCR